MTLAQLVQQAYLLATGKATAPTAGSNKYNKLVSLADVCQKNWANEPSVDWNSLYLKVTLPTTVTATDTIPLTASVNKISNRPGDSIKIIRLDGGETEYQLVTPSEFNDFETRVVAKIGSNLVFNKAFTADEAEIGGSVKVPCYSTVGTLASDADVIQVDNPQWLAYMVAAEYCRTDNILAYREDGLLQRAEDLMESMKNAQNGSSVTPVFTFKALGRTW